MGSERHLLGGDDDVLAVDQGAVDIKKDQFQAIKPELKTSQTFYVRIMCKQPSAPWLRG
jgi:hypothetical protein